MAVACLNSLFDSNAMKSIDFEWDRKKENANIKKALLSSEWFKPHVD